MKFQDKALYNLLRMNWLENPSLEVKPWQVEDYRKFTAEELFTKLQALGLNLSQKNFSAYAENCDSPEELAECLWIRDEDLEGYDKSYLLIFELWRRLFPDKQSLSIFCDELDYRIEKQNADKIQESLTELEDILDENADQGENPQKVFKMVSSFCAHELEDFLYDFIAEHIRSENELYASELLDGFYEFMTKKHWFDLLRAELFIVTDVEKSNGLIRSLLEELHDDPDFELLLEIGMVLIRQGEPDLFAETVAQARSLLKTEEDFQELLAVVADYYHFLDQEEEEKKVLAIIEKRAKRDLAKSFSGSDPDLSCLKDFNRSEV